MRRIVVFVLAFVAWFVVPSDVRCEGDAAPACMLCAGVRTVACPACAGKGRCASPCEVCDAKGRVACRYRADGADARLQRILSGLSGHDGVQRSCPNPLCLRGSIRWSDGKTSHCGLCGGDGKVRCLNCQAAQTACAACRGAGKIDDACLDCGGTGKLACLLCARSGEKCAQCGSGLLQCPRCHGAQTAVQPCATCAGRGVEVCAKCAGVGKVLCIDCDGTGRYRAVYTDGGAAASKHCSKCGGKGVTDCSAGADGWAKCITCGGAKRLSQKCRACEGLGSAACRACGTWGFRAAELEAGFLAKGDAKPAAKEAAGMLYDLAIDRARAAQRKASDEVERLVKDLGSIPNVPDDGADLDELQKSLAQLRAALTAVTERLTRFADAIMQVARFDTAVARCEKAVAALRSPPK